MGFDELNSLLDQEIDEITDINPGTDKLSIIVIDDDPDVRDALNLILSDTYKVTLCESGDEGISNVNKETHAVLLDIKMRGKDGFETFEAIKREWPDIPIIFHSAYQGIKDPYEIMNNYRPFGYILKGANSSELMDTLASASEFYRRKLENEKLIEDLQEANATLDHTNRKLGDALTQAKMSARVKSEFIANMSHELRTPLNCIINIPEHLTSQFTDVQNLVCTSCNTVFDCDDTEVPSFPCPQCNQEKSLEWQPLQVFTGDPKATVTLLTSVTKAGEKLASIVDNILDIGVLESGKLSIEREEFSVCEVVEEVVQNLSILASNKSITIVIPNDPDDTTIVADRVKLGQILVHLVGNAIKFSEEGAQVEITINKSDDKVTFAVRDWGIGIDVEHQNIIFESFRQADNTSTRPYGGTGLGLTITKRLVELHDGQIWLESEPDKGSCFMFYLPIRRDSQNPPRYSRLAPPKHPKRAGTIFILDDDEHSLNSARDALSSVGYTSEVSSDPTTAIKTIARLRPNLIILDIMMPKVSGLTILRKLREHQTLRNTTVLISSGFYANRDIVLEMGAHWIAKPWTPDELVNIVEQVLDAQVPG